MGGVLVGNRGCTNAGVNMKHLLFLILFLSYLSCFSQISQNNQIEEELFAFKVKQLDEFFERFNNDDSTLIRRYLENNNKEVDFNRTEIIESLLFLKDTKNSVKTSFLQEVVSNEWELSYFDEKWYAELDCEFTLGEESYPVYLFLEPYHTSVGSKWVIRSVDADFLPDRKVNDTSNILNPVSHATDFLGLHKALKDTTYFGNYFHPDYEFHLPTSFFYLVKFGVLNLEQVNKVTYHFLQLDNWIFTVNNYHRNNKKSGWLIDNIVSVTPEIKEKYLINVLKIAKP